MQDFAAQLSQGLVDRAIYHDTDFHRTEQRKIFGTCWLFLGHESMIPNAGDFVTTTMGDNPVIVSRSKDGKIHALLNSCTHRGNKVCLFDRGSADVFTCSYHGWKFGLDGSLRSVPYPDGAYYGELDKSQWGLIQVPRVELHGGLIFGSWDETAESLEVYLGAAGWYLDCLVLAQWGDGVDVVSGPHSYRVQTNWKVPSENNVGDHYHSLTTHKSLFKLGELDAASQGQGQPANGPFEVAISGGHGVGGIRTGQAAYERDVEHVRKLGFGRQTLKYVADRRQRQSEFIRGCTAQPYSCSHGLVFPNFTFSGHGGAVDGRALYVFQPRGPLVTEVWELAIVEREAPDIVKQHAIQELGYHGQLPAGIFAQDDAENFERVTEASAFSAAENSPYNLTMGIRQEGSWPGQESWNTSGMPGAVGPQFSEHSQRGFYRRLSSLMGLE
jgi:phenylpropionate dioxygenase-like ring-hydroxylating dioxygenase large terminal subunit